MPECIQRLQYSAFAASFCIVMYRFVQFSMAMCGPILSPDWLCMVHYDLVDVYPSSIFQYVHLWSNRVQNGLVCFCMALHALI